jgi:hypothetical protein
MKTIILNNVLNKQEQEEIINLTSIVNSYKDNSHNWINKENYSNSVQKLFNLANEHFDLSQAAGVEFWQHFATKPCGWHYDKDEVLYENTGHIRLPLCTFVYYVYINNLKGGEFLTEQLSYKPKTNDLVIFDSSLYHTVNDYRGERRSINFNPWIIKPISN